MKYSYSCNKENFSGLCDSVEEAILESLAEYGGEHNTVFIGEVHRKTIGGYFRSSDVEQLLERLAETAQEECGECAEDWLHGPYFESHIRGELPEEQKARVKAFRLKQQDRLRPLMQGIVAELEKWAAENDEQPEFWHVYNIKEYNCNTMKLVE